MQLAWPFMLLLLVPAIALFVWRLRVPAKHPVRPVAEVSSLAGLPSYAKIRRRGLLLAHLQQVALLLLVVTLVVLAARPLERIQKVDYENSRDIVLCLDASFSMQEFAPGALNAMSDIVKQNPTDRYALVLFQNASYAALPLTSDVAAITLKLKQMTDYYGKDSFSPVTTAGLDTGSLDDGGTDIAAGLAGCVRRFNDLDTPRSRHIILLSDMQHNTKSPLTPVAELLPKYGIKLYILAPSLDVETAKESPVTKIAGASVGTLEYGGDTKKVVNSIFSTILNQQKTTQYVLVDAPYTWWTVVIALAALWGGLQLLRWRHAS